MPADYRERVLPSVWVWLLVPAGAALVAIMLLPVSVTAAVIGAAVVFAVIGLVLWRTSPVITVAAGHLQVDRSRLPLAVISSARTLTGDELERALGVDLDARAHVRYRAWAHQGVRLYLDDPDDPAPYWVVSTRHAAQLRRVIGHPHEASQPDQEQ